MTKFTIARVPTMKPRKPRKKKLRIIKISNRRNMTIRFQHETLARLEKLLVRAHEAINPKICRTDLLEALVLDADVNRTNTELKNMLIAFGKGEYE